MAEECRAIAREQKEKMQAQFTKGKGEKRHMLDGIEKNWKICRDDERFILVKKNKTINK